MEDQDQDQKCLAKLYRYKTEEFLEKDVPFNQLEDRINEIRVETVASLYEWELISHNVFSRPDKEGNPEIVHYLIFRTKWPWFIDRHYGEQKNKPWHPGD